MKHKNEQYNWYWSPCVIYLDTKLYLCLALTAFSVFSVPKMEISEVPGKVVMIDLEEKLNKSCRHFKQTYSEI